MSNIFSLVQVYTFYIVQTLVLLHFYRCLATHKRVAHNCYKYVWYFMANIPNNIEKRLACAGKRFIVRKPADYRCLDVEYVLYAHSWLN